MSDTTRPSPEPHDGPSDSSAGLTEEQAREYLAQLRSVPAEQIVTEVLSGLLNASQAKLGRRDARLLLELSAALVEHSRQHLPADLAGQVDQVLEQLRRGQVQAEQAVADQGGAEPNDLAETPPAGADSQPGAAPTAPPASPPPQQPPASGLWVPGRDT